MKEYTRLTRINDEILREVSDIVRSELKDPRVNTITSVLRVDTTKDLKHCKLYVSVMGDEKQKEEAIKGLNSASGFIRKEIAARINLRNTPELKFVIDDSLDYSFKIDSILKEIKIKEE